jgi:hypothetical protein
MAHHGGKSIGMTYLKVLRIIPEMPANLTTDISNPAGQFTTADRIRHLRLKKLNDIALSMTYFAEIPLTFARYVRLHATPKSHHIRQVPPELHQRLDSTLEPFASLHGLRGAGAQEVAHSAWPWELRYAATADPGDGKPNFAATWTCRSAKETTKAKDCESAKLWIPVSQLKDGLESPKIEQSSGWCRLIQTDFIQTTPG